MSVFNEIYKKIIELPLNILFWFVNILYLYTLNPLKILTNWIYQTKHNQVKIFFFTAFFKNFLTWNYLLNTNTISKNFSVNNLSAFKKSKNKLTQNTTKGIENSMYNPYQLNYVFIKFIKDEIFLKLKIITYKSFSFSWYYLNGFAFVLFIDACLTDDEPLWEPIE